MPKSVSGKPIMLTGAAVYNEGSRRCVDKCRQAYRNNNLRLVKRKHGTDASTIRYH